MTIRMGYSSGKTFELLEVKNQTLYITSDTGFTGLEFDREDIGNKLVNWPRGLTEEGHFFVPNDPEGILEIY